jgi:hypothetical protein
MANTSSYQGAGVFVAGCTAEFNNNTITRNRATYSSTSAQGSGVFGYSGGVFGGRNNIIYGNIATANPNLYGTVNLAYSCVEGGLTGQGNISTDPLFVNILPTGIAFLSQVAAGQAQNSPCVNAGDPASQMIPGSTRTDMVADAGIVDMGFHWNHTLAQAASGLDLADQPMAAPICPVPQSAGLTIANMPNPFNPTTAISYELRAASSVTLRVYDTSGRLVSTLVEGWQNVGTHQATFNGSHLASGMYLYTLTAGDQTATGEMMLLK